MTFRNFIQWSVFLTLLLTGCSNKLSDDSRIQKGNFIATITETGELQAVNSYVIAVPFYGWHYGRVKIIHMEKEGITVQKGSVVAKLDTSVFIKELNEKQIDLAINQADYNKLLVQQASGRKDMQMVLQSDQTALEGAIIDTQRVQFEPENKQLLSHLRYQRQKLTSESNIRKYELLLKIQAEERKIQETRIQQTKLAMQKAQYGLKRFTIRTPSNGMIEYRYNRRTRQKFKIGDEVRPGRDIIGLPDLRQIKVKTSVHESDIYKIKKGQKVSVRLDAYPQKVFTGNVTTIGFTCHEKDEDSKIKVFDVEVLINETDITLKPGMTVSCQIETANLKDVFYVSNAYIGQQGDSYYILRKKGTGSERIPVTLGARNAKYVTIKGNVKKGDRILMPSQTGDLL